MGKYFGTDGFRGEANKNLTADHAFKIGRFLGWYYQHKKDNERCRIVIGKDTRRSSYMFEYSFGGRCDSLRSRRVSIACNHNPQRILCHQDRRL